MSRRRVLYTTWRPREAVGDVIRARVARGFNRVRGALR